MKIKALTKMTIINQHKNKIIKIGEGEIFTLHGVSGQKNMILYKKDFSDNIAIDINYYQFFEQIKN